MMKEKITNLLNEIIDAKTSFGRASEPVTLLAVSKTFSAEKVRQAYEAGLSSFGENYLQEALSKQEKLTDLDIEWHFIGPIQSNKTALIAEHFSWVHTLSREKEAKRLNDARPKNVPPLNVCLQVNINQEPQKNGLSPKDLESFCQKMQDYPNLRLRGLMTIPEACDDFKAQCDNFRRLRVLFETLGKEYALDTLSMGMSNDYVAAIKEGSNLIRIGRAIFGERET